MNELPDMTGADVASYMKRYRLSQSELATLLGSSRTMVIRWIARPKKKIRRVNSLALAYLAEEILEDRLLEEAGV